MTEVKVKSDCRFFRGDRPCSFHKTEGVTCPACGHYAPVRVRICIVKLGAPGDVLRTTCILAPLSETHPDSRITWCTREEAIPLLAGNPYVDRVLDVSSTRCLTEIDAVDYDLALGLDADPESAQLTERVAASQKRGFGFSRKGYVRPLDPDAEAWFEMGLSDELKRGNTRTYQECISRICGLNGQYGELLLPLTEEERAFAVRFAQTHGWSDAEPVIGLNTGAGRRWQHKRWTEKGFAELAAMIRRHYPRSVVLLYGGPEERERNARLAEVCGQGVVNTGCDHPVREFAALVGLSDVLVTGDTLALHIGVALRTQVVALFGPTSAAEIELYGRGVKLSAGMDCTVCYRERCDISPSCMDKIQASEVFEAVKARLGM